MKQILIAFDQLLNALFFGYADETLSARAYRMSTTSRKWEIAEKVINGIFFWQDNHCFESWESEMERRQLPVEYR